MNTTGCNFAFYENNLNALNIFSSNVSSLVISYLTSPGLHDYQDSYFNYYNAVS